MTYTRFNLPPHMLNRILTMGLVNDDDLIGEVHSKGFSGVLLEKQVVGKQNELAEKSRVSVCG